MTYEQLLLFLSNKDEDDPDDAEFWTRLALLGCANSSRKQKLSTTFHGPIRMSNFSIQDAI